jgi:hypothetical protein
MKEENILKVYQTRILRGKFGPKAEEVAGG